MSGDTCEERLVDPGRVATVRQTMPSSGQVEDLADVFSLLGDPNRLRLLVALLEGGELCVCDLAAACGMGESAVSHALRLLRAHRVVTVSRRGRMAYYRLEDAHVRMLLELGRSHTEHSAPLHTDHGHEEHHPTQHGDTNDTNDPAQSVGTQRVGGTAAARGSSRRGAAARSAR